MLRFRQDPWMVDAVKQHFVAVAIDAYWPGTSADIAFRNKLHAAGASTGNNFSYCTATGEYLGGDYVGSPPETLKKVIEAWKARPERDRRTALELPKANPDKVAPCPPRSGLIANVFCVYLDRDGKRLKKAVAEERPVEPEIDKLWLTDKEWKSLVPASPRKGERRPVPDAILRRIFCKHATEFMNGSTGELALRSGELHLTVESASESAVQLRLDGHALLGKMFEDYDGKQDGEGSTVGCDVRLLGTLRYDTRKQAFTRFDIVGLGESWGPLTDWQRGGRGRWPYGVAFELAAGEAPADRVPPYNMLAYNLTRYFEEKE